MATHDNCANGDMVTLLTSLHGVAGSQLNTWKVTAPILYPSHSLAAGPFEEEMADKLSVLQNYWTQI